MCKEFVKLLFDDTEWGLVSQSVRETKAKPLVPNICGRFFVINPLKPNTTRSSANVSTLRNFLVEFDGDLSIDEQLALATKHKIPYTTALWSGNRSVHLIISLKEPVMTIDEYRTIWRKISKKVPEADKATNDPARFSRFPDGINEKTLKHQKILDLKSRVQYTDIQEWLKDIKIPNHKVKNPPLEGHKRSPPLNVLRFIFATNPGERHRGLINASLGLRSSGYTKLEIMNVLNEVFLPKHKDFPKEECEKIVDWVFNKGE